jgi:NAD-dependent deacetylase
MFSHNMQKAIELIKSSTYITALTGAGISTLSGLADFRGEHNPIWDKYPQEKIFDRDYFDRDPKLFYDFLRDIMKKEYDPNIAHIVLKKMEDEGMLKAVITQNIDGLHQKAGAKKVYELHGSIYSNYCVRCEKEYLLSEFMDKLLKEDVPKCSCGGVIRPGIVFFGEPLPEEDMQLSVFHASKSDLMLVVGTSLFVQPAAYMPMHAINNDAQIIMVNKGETYLDDRAAFAFPDIKRFFEELAEEY